MKKSGFRTCTSLASLARAVAFAQPAFAQQAADEADTGLDEIVVTASTGDKTQLNSSVSVTSVKP